MYSCYARRISFEINPNSKEIRRAEHEYMNIKHPPPPPPISVLDTSLLIVRLSLYRFCLVACTSLCLFFMLNIPC